MRQWQSREVALKWDAEHSKQLPTRAEQQDILLQLLESTEIGDDAVLDLGVGSGLVAEAVLERLPQARLVGIDVSPPMLEIANDRLRRFETRIDLIRCDLADVASVSVPPLTYRAAFSVQTLHHLSDAKKAAVIAWTAGVIQPGGLIVIVDRVRVSRGLFHDWAVLWRRIDPQTPETYVEYLAELRDAGDRPAFLRDQLGYLAAAGLDATCLHLYGNRAVLVGRKPDLDP